MFIQSNSVNMRKGGITKVFTVTHNISEDNKNLKSKLIMKLISAINCFHYLNTIITLI